MNVQQSLEQMSAFLRDFSPMMYSYYQNLIKAGFDKEEAFQLARDYQRSVLSQKEE